MLESENSRTIDELSHEISIEVLRKLKIKRTTGMVPLSENYQCIGKKYVCGKNYGCDPSSDHSCLQYFECRHWYVNMGP
jgi:hypothetical protein